MSSILSSGALMAAGTIVSRLSGFVRGLLLAAALGTALHADVFSIANTIPNMLYILLAGGIFNAVLVPQLVRSAKKDADGGAAYTNRIVTLAALFLFAISVVLVLAAPLVMGLFLDSSWDAASMTQARESVVTFARYCLPQVFFYGMFVLVGQILNARGSFGPMMWAPIANNIISITVLVLYLVIFGSASGPELCQGFSGGQEFVLGFGSTVGIAAQLMILIPYLKKAGFTFQPRFDFRNAGLGHTLKLGVWTVLFVMVNQVAYTVVVRLASSGTAGAAVSGCGLSSAADATGYTIYSQSFLLMMVPHSIITVSLATALLPQLSARAAASDPSGLAWTLTSTLRTVLALVLPVLCLFPVIAPQIAKTVWAYGAASSTYQNFVPTLTLFAPGILFFTVHYLVLRGFYALERTRTVFYIQCCVAAVNIVLAVLLVGRASPAETSPALVLAYSGSYLVGAVISYAVLRRVLGGLYTEQLLRFLARLVVAAAVATLVSWLLAYDLGLILGDDPPAGHLVAILTAALLAGVHMLVFAGMAQVLWLDEVNEVIGLLTRRLRRH